MSQKQAIAFNEKTSQAIAFNEKYHRRSQTGNTPILPGINL
ncbi:hypothetical protein [Calothrix sp. FACHB-1219]|nr:hypothetical protein [Calothrix sp. FACHB-1219]